MTTKERIMLRDYLNQFSDRWPEEYQEMYHEYYNHKEFQIAILYKLLKWARPDREDSMEIYELIKGLEAGQDVTLTKEESAPVRYKIDVKIEEVGNGKL